MLIRQGDERDGHLDRGLAFTLAAVAGGLNAAAFHAIGFFSANMTGNVSSLSSLLALGQWQHGLGYLLIVLTFVAGAMLSTLTIDAGLRSGITTIYARVVIAEAVALALLGLARTALDTAIGVPFIVLGLSFLMGLQNAIVTHISDARIRTTHVSGMSTDIGIGIARMIDVLLARGDPLQLPAIMNRLGLHAGTVAFFFLGGVAGVALYRFVGDIAFSFAAIPLIVIAIPSFTRSSSLPVDQE